jgi:sugar fermentation stimulation protein A
VTAPGVRPVAGRRSPDPGAAAAVALPVAATLRGTLVRRYQRFFADVRTEDGDTLTAHCPNPGSMRGLLQEGAAVRCSRAPSAARRLPYTLEMIRAGRAWVGVHTHLANAFAARMLGAGALPALAGYASLRREVPAPGGSRLDFLLEGRPEDPRPAFVEVKSVTLAEGACARFPDSVTARGRRHAECLASLRAAGARAVLLFVVQRGDCERVEPADEIDPDYGAALRAAARAGVEVLAVRARVGPTGIRYECPLPVAL